MEDHRPSDWLTVQEVAAKLYVSPQTVRNWIRRKRLAAVQGVTRGAFRIPSIEVEAFLRRQPAVAIDLRPSTENAPLDLTDPSAFYAARIQPTVTALGEGCGDAVLRRMVEDPEANRLYPRFGHDYAFYVGRMVDRLEGSDAE